jgi:hypothetical protein
MKSKISEEASLYAGDTGERSIDDQFHQFGAAKVESGKSGATGAIVSSRRKSSARLTPNDTKSWKGGSAPLPAYA